jgi:hypothetical protein
MADEFDAMAGRAATLDARHALERLAARCRVYAAQRAARRRNAPVKPGAPAPTAGTYELRNVHGTRAGGTIQVRGGEILPRAAQEFTWHQTESA